MLRSLAIRQLVLLADLVLVLLVALVAFQLVVRLLESDTVLAEPGDKASFEAPDPGRLIAKAGPKAKYASIVDSGLFGEAGRISAAAPPKKEETQPEIQEDVTETRLNLKLLGTTVVEPRAPWSSAIIENLDRREKKTCFVGDEVVEQVTLQAVYPHEVILLNARTGKTEFLAREDAPPGETHRDRPDTTASASTSPNRTSMAPAVRKDRIELDKREFFHDLYGNFHQIVQEVQPELVTDEQGNVTGITASNLTGYPLAAKLGLQDGDVVETINGERIDSARKIFEIVNRNARAQSFTIGLMRNGQRTTKTYNLQ